MKIIFLDIDGVLNRDGTRERCCRFVGVDKQLAGLFTDWFGRLRDTHLVLSSTWRRHKEMWPCLHEAGIRWMASTPFLAESRGIEINSFLSSTDLPIERYAILDDDGDMLPNQLPFFVQTDTRVGVTERHLMRLESILNAGRQPDATLTPGRSDTI